MKLLNYIIFFFIVLIFTSCKKKTDIEVKLYNPYLDEYVSDATIAIIERKGNAGGGIFSSSASCKEVATAITDANGMALFNDTKLKRREGFVYYPVLKEAWGITNNYPCGGYNGAFLTKGGTNTVIKSDRTEGGVVKLQYNNLFSPAISGDSINLLIDRIVGYDSELGHNLFGSGMYRSRIEAYDSTKPIYPNVIISTDTKINGKFIVYYSKRKMGVVTTTIDTIKAYPNQTTTIMINW